MMSEAVEDRLESEALIGRNLTIFAEIIGFAAFVCGVLLLILRTSILATVAELPQSLLLAAATAVCLLAASTFNDWLITARGRVLLMTCSLVGCCVGSVGLLLSGVGMVFLLIAGVGITSSALVWGYYLSEQTHFMLLLITAVAFIFAGIVSVLVFRFDIVFVAVAIIFHLLLAWVCSLLTQSTYSEERVVSRSTSIVRSVHGRKNRFTLFTNGALLGVAACILARIPVPLDERGLFFGISIIAAGILMLVIRRFSRLSIEETLRQVLTTVTAVVLLPIPFLPAGLQVVPACFLMFFMTTHLIVLINAIAETTRFNMISSVWIFGIEVFFVVLGACVGNLVFWWGFGVSGDSVKDAMLCVGTVILCSFMQVFIQMQSYPIKELDNGLVVRQDFDDGKESSLTNRAVWRTRLNVIADRRDLSPRQREVMELLIKGRDTNYIMEHFVISRATAKTHIYNLYKKLAVHSRQELLDLIERADD